MKVTRPVEVKSEEGIVLLTGSVTFNTYPYQDRIRKYQEIMKDVRVGEDSTQEDDLKLADRYFSVLQERVEAIDVTTAEGEKIETVQDLYEYAEGIALGNDLALQLVSSQRLGKQKLN
jgi:hypothetical protein